MAKLSVVARELRRQEASAKARASRKELRNMICNPNVGYEEKSALVDKLNKKPRNQSDVRVKRRCRSCGRPRAVYRKFAICRLCLRIAAMRGDVPGLVKASW
jgi:small subunit ribosomal protein S14